MLELLVGGGVVIIFAGALYLRRKMPWPFELEGQRYRRMPDGTFQDAKKMQVTDPAMLPKLEAAYKSAKYGSGELQAWDVDNA